MLQMPARMISPYNYSLFLVFEEQSYPVSCLSPYAIVLKLDHEAVVWDDIKSLTAVGD